MENFDAAMAMSMLRTGGLLLGWTAVIAAFAFAIEKSLGRA